jgi:hypothetical protein
MSPAPTSRLILGMPLIALSAGAGPISDEARIRHRAKRAML